jgi:tripartite-type tricarboxylate transporter receptor subunit TctC
MTGKWMRRTAVALMAVTGLRPGGVQAQQPSNSFYQGKNIAISVVAAGGLYALNAQLLANHMQRYIPGGPNIVMTVRTGAGGLTNLNYLANAAPRDGTAIALIPKDLALYQLISFEGAIYDVRTLNWLGSISPMYTTLLFWHEAPIRTIAEAKSTPLVMAASGANHPTALFPRFMNNQLGTKFRIVVGYRGGADIFLAFENGEAQGTAIAWDNVRANKNAWIEERKVIPLVQLSFDKSHDLPDVPLLRELMSDEDNRRMANILVAGSKIGMALVAPPGVPADRVVLLRRAFDETMRDPQFRAEAQKRKLDVDPVSGSELSEFIDSLMRDASPQLVSRLKTAIGIKN